AILSIGTVTMINLLGWGLVASVRGRSSVHPRSTSRLSHRIRHNESVTELGARSRVMVIVVFDDVTMLDVAGAGEVFAEANRFGADYRLKIASVDGRDVTTSIGTRLGVTDAISSINSADTVMVAGGDNLPRRAIDPGLVEAIKSVAGRTRRLAPICTGAVVLAHGGPPYCRHPTTHLHV